MNEKDWLIVVLTIVVLGIIIIHVDNQYNTITLDKDFFNDIVRYFNN